MTRRLRIPNFLLYTITKTCTFCTMFLENNRAVQITWDQNLFNLKIDFFSSKWVLEMNEFFLFFEYVHKFRIR